PRLTAATLTSSAATRPGRGFGFHARHARCTVHAARMHAGTARCVLFHGIFSDVQENASQVPNSHSTRKRENAVPFTADHHSPPRQITSGKNSYIGMSMS